MKKRPNLLDVAKHAGVSPATVSRVINDTAHVRDTVRLSVLSSMRTLGYEPTPSRTNAAFESTVAVIIPDILNPYFAEIVRGVQDETSAAGFIPILLDSCEDIQREQQLLRMAVGQSTSGIILCASRLPLADLLAIRHRYARPMIVINRSLHHPNIACIMVDLEGATYRAARHLLELGHKRIAFLAGPSTSEQSQARRRGIERALTEAGLCLRPELCPASFPNVHGGFQAASALLALAPSDRPSGMIAYNDMMALGALHASRAHRQRVPEDLSVIGIDDIAMAAHTNPPLTTLSQPKYRIGRLAMETLQRMAQGHPPPEDSFTLMESPLIVRESTGPAPGSNGVHP